MTFFQTSVSLALCHEETRRYGRKNVIYICFSKNSQGRELKLNFKKELQVGEEISVETFSRQESLEKFGFENSLDNIAAIEGIIENLPADSVVVFDEVPLESRSVKQDIKVVRQKASHDWSSLRNRRPTEVPAVVFCFVFYLIFRPGHCHRVSAADQPGADKQTQIKIHRDARRCRCHCAYEAIPEHEKTSEICQRPLRGGLAAGILKHRSDAKS